MHQMIEIFITGHTPRDREVYTNLFLKSLSELTGGCTVIKGRGGYINTAGRLIVEPVNILISLCDDSQDIFEKVKPDILEYLKVCDQEAALVKLNGIGKLIELS
jgi:hypothetical protein